MFQLPKSNNSNIYLILSVLLYKLSMLFYCVHLAYLSMACNFLQSLILNSLIPITNPVHAGMSWVLQVIFSCMAITGLVYNLINPSPLSTWAWLAKSCQLVHVNFGACLCNCYVKLSCDLWCQTPISRKLDSNLPATHNKVCYIIPV